MNWIKENKFLAGFIAVLLIGIGVLGWLVLSAKTAMEESESTFASQTTELNRLQGLSLFPNQENVKKLDEQRKQVEAAFKDLQKSLAANEIPLEPMTPIEFQDSLRKTVISIREKAGTYTNLGEKFYLDFDKYETEPPDKDAAAPLGRQMKAITWVVEQFISARAATLKIARNPLPEEASKARQAQTPAPGPGNQSRGKADDKGKNLVTKSWFEIVVLMDEAGFRDVLNKIVTSPDQFFIPRVVEVKNDKPEPPVREIAPVAVVAPAPVDPAATPAAAGAVAKPADAPGAVGKYIVGEEKVEVTLRIEIVDFADVAAK